MTPAAQRAAAPAARRLRRVAVRAVAEPLARPAGDAGANGGPAHAGSSIPITSVGAGAAALAFAPPPPPPAAINIPDPIPGVLPPAAVYAKVVDGGAGKAALPWQKVLVLGIMAGVYIGFGALLSQVVGGNCPGLAAANPGMQKMLVGAIGLPVGLMLVLICGGELFTGNTAFVTAAALEGRASPRQLAKSWACSYIGNAIGTALFISAICASGLMATATAPPAAAVAKTSLAFGTAFVRGVLCNMFVCLGIWQATAATSLTGKFVGSWLPVSAFAAIGFEHSVANMFLVPMGIALGAPVALSTFLTANLLPVTLGNIVGGVLVALAYAYSFGSLGKPKTA
ncbi:nitrite transporter [Raphidocelis subcapitata]|uniref:Nitrite transporter n=1 Tax=Raphidocelis subcapitata TaxID=307507 RepID=A0A2V0NYB1_9CHLO|nr:nitrite transporter [Raphidocelis subcapitata]|eukprot:GBF90570.1 nitrite transporter [Raphidocelis subcapitata]